MNFLFYIFFILLDVLTDMNSVFQALFFGTGSWLGLLLMLTFIVGLAMAWRSMGLLMLPVAVLFGTVYLTNALGWHGLIMFLAAIFIVIQLGIRRKRGD